ncbi:MAG: GDSL-type esterase/lipase family protein [Candidatus Gastranaerophilales bacterium]|nr:GDSL-type esterase/lipase family protein [Candidatus Gastranaerophilales bacterium]
MKTIFCYGDSNTYGYKADDHTRFDKNTRWTGVLTNLLKNKCNIVEEGCNNRTAFVKSYDGLKQSGLEYLDSCLPNCPIDYFIFALGANDLQYVYKLEPKDIEAGLIKFIKKLKSYKHISNIIVIEPPELNQDIKKGFFSFQFNDYSINLSKCVHQIYSKVADSENVELITFGKDIKTAVEDNLHYTKEAHSLIGHLIFEKIKNKILTFDI